MVERDTIKDDGSARRASIETDDAAAGTLEPADKEDLADTLRKDVEQVEGALAGGVVGAVVGGPVGAVVGGALGALSGAAVGAGVEAEEEKREDEEVVVKPEEQRP
jgi:outer membrane lipoprotein SlyB